jgi:hypothetical protein
MGVAANSNIQSAQPFIAMTIKAGAIAKGFIKMLARINFFVQRDQIGGCIGCAVIGEGATAVV